MKKFREGLIGYEGKIYVTMVLLLCLFFVLVISFFSKNIFATETKVKSNVVIEEFYENSNPIDLNSIIEQNTSTDIKEEMVVEETDMEYTTRYRNNSDLPNGVIQVLQEGRAGTQKATIIKKYENNELVSEEQVADQVIKAPVERIVEVGTGNQNVDYSINAGEEFHVVSNSVAVRLKADSNSEKICTLNKDDIGTVITINNEWCFISSDGIKGYVPKNCIATKVVIPEEVVPEKTELTKQELLEKLDINMDLRQPSGLTLDQFKKVLSNDSNDKNGVFASNSEYFYYIEEQYGVNGIFVASVGIHESGWGTSSISKNKKNLFGYGAVDSNPSGGAYSFNTYSEGIDLIARVFVKYYINPPGTTIYDGTGASGKFYSGSNLSSINSKYASDKNWASSVYKWMQYLYNKL